MSKSCFCACLLLNPSPVSFAKSWTQVFKATDFSALIRVQLQPGSCCRRKVIQNRFGAQMWPVGCNMFNPGRFTQIKKRQAVTSQQQGGSWFITPSNYEFIYQPQASISPRSSRLVRWTNFPIANGGPTTIFSPHLARGIKVAKPDMTYKTAKRRTKA